jgi:peptidylprolyl isomerase
MKRREILVAAIVLSVTAWAAVIPAHAQNLDLENTIYLDTKYGRTVIKLRPDLAPNHVKRIKKLSREGFYNGVKFHRVIEGFMAQSGDPTGTGTGGSKYKDLRAEFSLAPFERGTLGMARSSSPHSANSQFFICFSRASSLNGQYTVFGEVVSGMEFIDKIRRGRGNSGMVSNPDKIKKMQVAADAK